MTRRGGPAADSAGVPWRGRTLTPQPFTGDDGGCDPGLRSALDEHARGALPLAGVVAAWSRSRVLVPVVATPDADMALAVLVADDDRRALPAFTSVAALAAWDPAARPVPVEAARAAQAAVVENCDVVVVDPGSAPTVVLPRPAVWAVAAARDWLPPAEDAEVLAAVGDALAGLAGVGAHRCEPDGDAGLAVVLGLRPGLGEDDARRAAQDAGARLAAERLVTERVENVRLVLRTL